MSYTILAQEVDLFIAISGYNIMAHFAKIENSKVINCIVIKNQDCGGGDFPESEALGKTFIASLGLEVADANVNTAKIQAQIDCMKGKT